MRNLEIIIGAFQSGKINRNIIRKRIIMMMMWIINRMVCLKKVDPSMQYLKWNKKM
jgi:hypothetical protein